MTSHVCSRCGQVTDCPNRNLGTGRQRPLSAFDDNHAAILERLKSESWKWMTVLDVFFALQKSGVRRTGKREYWLDSDVQNKLSDLVGWGYVKMERVPNSRRWMYRWAKDAVQTVTA